MNILTKFNSFIAHQLDSAPARFLENLPNAFLQTPGKIIDPILQTKITPITQKLGQGNIGGAVKQVKSNVKYTAGEVAKQQKTNPLLFVSNFITGPENVGKEALGKTIAKSSAVAKFIKPSESIIGKQGEAGAALKQLLTKAADTGEVEAGKRIAALKATGLAKLTKEDSIALHDILEGRAEPGKLDTIASSIKQQLDEVATRAKEYGVKVREKKILTPEDVFFGDHVQDVPPGLTDLQRTKLKAGQNVPATLQNDFKARENFYPHQIPSTELLNKGEVRADIIDNIVSKGIKPTKQEAATFLNDYIDYVENGTKEHSLVQYLVDTGQAKTPEEAFRNLQNFRTKSIKRQGSLEYARNVDLPFYDPNPQRVLPNYLINSEKRLAQIKHLGQDDQAVNKLILDIRDSGGDADFVRQAVDQILNKVNSTPNKGLNLLRTLQGFKLSLATIPNSTQGVLNSFLAADLRAVGAGIKGALTAAGRDLALRSGATLDAVTKEAVNTEGGNVLEKGLQTMLKWNGFNATEKFNRALAANAGANYSRRLFTQVLKNPADTAAREFLQEMGIDVEKAIQKGEIGDDEILMAAKKFSDLTQFRSRPQDLPKWASTESGKVFFQFKNFIYGQTRLLDRVTVQELKSGNYGRAVRNLLILGTIFPLTGEAVSDVRSILTGSKRTKHGLSRYFENIGNVGAMGILADAIQSAKYGQGVEYLAGPTISTAGQLLNAAGSSTPVKDVTKTITSQLPFGSIIKNRLFPPKSKAKAKPKPFKF